MALTEKTKHDLRGRGHTLKPVVSIGNAGLSKAVLREIELSLEHHELMKIKVGGAERDKRKRSSTESVTALMPNWYRPSGTSRSSTASTRTSLRDNAPRRPAPAQAHWSAKTAHSPHHVTGRIVAYAVSPCIRRSATMGVMTNWPITTRDNMPRRTSARQLMRFRTASIQQQQHAASWRARCNW